jgi:hypothetical protein
VFGRRTPPPPPVCKPMPHRYTRHEPVRKTPPPQVHKPAPVRKPAAPRHGRR